CRRNWAKRISIRCAMSARPKPRPDAGSQEAAMSIRTTFFAIAIAAMMFTHGLRAQQPAEPGIDSDDIGGIVTSRFGPEAGVWVIAETTDLGTRFAKMAVTDERGRYVVPDLPKAGYRVWVRGYGLVASPKETADPGKILTLTAEIAPNLAAAAQY